MEAIAGFAAIAPLVAGFAAALAARAAAIRAMMPGLAGAAVVAAGAAAIWADAVVKKALVAKDNPIIELSMMSRMMSPWF